MLRLLPLALAFSLLLPAADVGQADQPRLEPLSGHPPYPPDNPPTPEKISLGKEIFFDNALSGNLRRSCSTCHKPELYFTDGFSRGWGLHDTELRRKTPNLLNVGWQRTMFFDSRVDTLEEQVAKPLENPHELDLNPAEAAERLARDPYYKKMFAKVFPGEPITFDLVSKAVASYERTLVSYDSDLDRYLLGDESALSPEAKRGMEVFTGKAGCIRCHHGPLLTDHERHYTGVAENAGDNAPGTKYKTQSLRDAMRRYSYMHNGEMLKIDDVFDHYQQGGNAPAGLEAEIEPVELTAADRSALKSFLRALDGRVTELLDSSPPDTDVFNTRRRPPPESSDSGPVQDPSYVKRQPDGPVQDPSYVPKQRPQP